MIRLVVLLAVTMAGAALAWWEGEGVIAISILIGGLALAVLRHLVPRPPQDD